MLRFIAILLIAVILLAGAFIALAPASLIAPRLEKSTGGALSARDVEGTIWRGRAILAAGAAQFPFAWTLDASPLVNGELRARVTGYDAAAATPRGDVQASPRHVVVRNANVVVPATVLMQGTTLGKIGMVASGDIEAATPQLDWTPGALGGNVKVSWRNARLMLPPFPPVDLGELTADLASTGNRLAGPIRNAGGDLDIRGDASIGVDRSAAVNVTLTPRRADDAALTNVLAAFGQPDGAGWRFAWRTPPR
jgi:hypothetical protein